MLTLLYILIGIIGAEKLFAAICRPFYDKRGTFKFFFHDMLYYCRPDKDNPGKCAICGKEIK